MKARYFLVRMQGLSNKEANVILNDGRLKVNGQIISSDYRIYPSDEISLDDKVIRAGKEFIYLAYYKPRGIESTMNKEIDSNLSDVLPFDDIFPVGRLDKESEGLMLMTNDGHLYKDLALSSAQKEKEYIVTVDRPVSEEDLEKLSSGVVIMGQKTREAHVERINEDTFRIVLTQGLNRQIRRMCYKLGLEVQRLIRIRIDVLQLKDLAVGEWRLLDSNEISDLKRTR